LRSSIIRYPLRTSSSRKRGLIPSPVHPEPVEGRTIRSLALSLTIALAFPHPAFALRQTAVGDNAGLEENLSAALKAEPTVGLEEAGPDQLIVGELVFHETFGKGHVSKTAAPDPGGTWRVAVQFSDQKRSVVAHTLELRPISRSSGPGGRRLGSGA